MEQIKLYLKRNWFRIGIVMVLLFVAIKKDLSFKVHLNNPPPTEQRQPATRPAQELNNKQNTERFSEHTPPSDNGTIPKIESFDLGPGGSSRKPPKAIDKLSQVDAEIIQKYIDRFDRVARSEKEKFGIPASIILANAMLHSQAGTQKWAANSTNNHFALPCTNDWRGPDHQFNGKCFREYENAWTSFRDHSLYLTTGPFAHLTQLSSTDYKKWAQGIEQAGFSGEPQLSRQLIQLIESYHLNKLDN